MTSRTFSLPPIEQLHHGAVWFVTLDSVASQGKTGWDEVWAEKVGTREHLVLVTASWRGWPANDSRGGWWRSRLVVGDLGLREESEIRQDFRHLLLQTPPVRRNWRKDLACGRYDKKLWHLTWLREVSGVL